jgi:prophage regulatory protein
MKSIRRTVPVLPQEGFVRLTTVLAVFPVSKSTWWAGVKTGRYPRPHKIGPRCTAWKVEDIRALIGRVGSGQMVQPLPDGWRA